MPRKRKHKRTAKRPPARHRTARRRALDKPARERRARPGDEKHPFDQLLPMCTSIGMNLAVRAICALELNWDVIEDADPGETFDDVCDQMGTDGVLIREVLSAALCYQDRGGSGEPEEVAGDVLDLLDELHEIAHGGMTGAVSA